MAGIRRSSVFPSIYLNRILPANVRINKFFLFLFTINILNPSFPQNKNLRFEHFSIEQGLSQSIVTSIIQDKNGFLWFGTEDGLNRYDGYQFTVFKHDPDDSLSISDNGIMSLFKDRNDEIWIGTDKRGLNKYNYKTGKFVHIKTDEDFACCKVNSICDDNKGNLWVGTDRGLFKYKPGYGSLTSYKNIPDDLNSISNNTVKTVFYDKDGILWAGTENGLNKYNKTKDNFTRYFYESAFNKNKFLISNIFEDRSGYLWIGTFTSGIIRLNKQLNRFEFFKQLPSSSASLSNNDVRKIFEDRFGNIWVGTVNGLNRFIKESNTFIKYVNIENNPSSLSCNEIISIFQDNDGIIWIGTFSGGINKLDIRQEVFLHYSHSADNQNCLSENYVTSITADRKGNIWIGTNLTGLNGLNKVNGRFKHFINKKGCNNCISQNTILTLHCNNSNTLWIGTYLDGLNKYDIDKDIFTHYPIDKNGSSASLNSATIYSLLEDNNFNLWIGTRNGLNRLDLRTNSFSHYIHNSNKANSISDNIVLSLHYDKDNILWIGTVRGGLNRFNPKSEIFTRYLHDPKVNTSVSSNRVQSIYEMPNDQNQIWIGTDHGLNKFNKATGKFFHYEEGNELNEISIFSIMSDDKNNLWLNTNKGIIKFNPSTNYLKHFTAKDGLQGIEFETNACYKDKNGFFYIGGPAGFNVFHPDNIKINSYLPPVVLTSFKKFNKEVNFNKSLLEIDTINLSYEDYVISFEFAGLSYAQPDLNRYAYRLDGFDKNWVYTDASKRFATYTNLKPGKYVLRIKASNNDGIWNEKATKIFVFIKPPLWENIFFKLAAFLLALTLIFLYVNSKIKKIKLERQKQNQFSKLLIESQEDERKRLSKELHDSLGQNLLVIKNLVHIYQNSDKREDKELENISSLIKDTIGEVKEISTTLHPHQLERLGLKKALISMINKISQSVDITFKYEIDDISGFIPQEAEINIFRIVQEALNNIIKHSKAASAGVSIKNEDSQVKIIIEDSGKGFDINDKEFQNKMDEGLGLKSMQERARLLNGEFIFESTTGVGTKIIIIIKKTAVK